MDDRDVFRMTPAAFLSGFWSLLPVVDRVAAGDVLNATIHMNRALKEEMTHDKLDAYSRNLQGRIIVDSKNSVYLRRFRIDGWMPGDPKQEDLPDNQKRLYNVYLHHIVRADEDTLMHNHPWEWAESLILCGGYTEMYGVLCEEETENLKAKIITQPNWKRYFGAGTRNTLGHTDYHNITNVDRGTWTLFVCGMKTKSWGFYDEARGHIPWRDRLAERGIQAQY